MENFLRGHVGAFMAWGAVPRVLLYDNLKSAVLESKHLLALPDNPYATDEQVAVKIGKTP